MNIRSHTQTHTNTHRAEAERKHGVPGCAAQGDNGGLHVLILHHGLLHVRVEGQARERLNRALLNVLLCFGKRREGMGVQGVREQSEPRTAERPVVVWESGAEAGMFARVGKRRNSVSGA